MIKVLTPEAKSFYPNPTDYLCAHNNPLPLYALGVIGGELRHGGTVAVGSRTYWFITEVALDIPQDIAAMVTVLPNSDYKNRSSPNPAFFAKNGLIMIGLCTLGGETSMVDYGDLIAEVTFLKKAF